MGRREIKEAFMPFYSNRTGGTGLGLYLARRLVNEMNGTIEIESIVGVKTEVIITIAKTTEE
jgi:signal transduction histidine kinase